MTSPQSLALCIPAYNAAAYLPRLLESANLQQIPFDEIWVYDDCSTDETGLVAAKYGANVVRGDTNRGCSYGKNTLAERTSCDWIHFHDADDLLLPNFTVEAHKWMNMNDPPDVVLMGFEYKDFYTNELLATGLVDDHLLHLDPIGFSIRYKIPNFGIYKRNPIVNLGGFDCDPSILYNEDVAFHTKLAINGLSMRASNVITSINWRYGSSMSQTNVSRCLLAQYAVMLKVASQVQETYFSDVASNLWMTGQGLAVLEQWENVDQVLESALSLYPEVPLNLSWDFRLTCHLIGPKPAFRLREYLIRIFKSKLRSH